MQFFLGTILLWPITFAPRNWAFCDGQLLRIDQHQDLFSLLGTTYGGDGRRDFALPNLRGRVPVGIGGNAIPNLGNTAGSENVTLQISQMPGHSHALNCNNVAGSGDSNNPENSFPGVGQTSGSGPAAAPLNTNWAGSRPSGVTTTMNPDTIALTGGSQPHENMQPSVGLNYIICLQGIFPSRN